MYILSSMNINNSKQRRGVKKVCGAKICKFPTDSSKFKQEDIMGA